MAFTVGELARLTGVTVRALHHYDEIGLCRPSQRSGAGYRLYDDADVLRLQQVLVLRELGLPLEEIARIIDGEPDRRALLARHRAALVARRGALDAMIAAVDAALTQGANAMQPDDVKKLFDGFDHTQHEAEAEQRWGHTPQFQESARRTKGYTQADWARYKAEAAEVNARIAGFMRAGLPVGDPQVQAAIEDHRLLIDRWFYPCPVELHKGLGQMYVSDPRFQENLDRLGDGYAQYLSAAIAVSS